MGFASPNQPTWGVMQPIKAPPISHQVAPFKSHHLSTFSAGKIATNHPRRYLREQPEDSSPAVTGCLAGDALPPCHLLQNRLKETPADHRMHAATAIKTAWTAATANGDQHPVHQRPVCSPVLIRPLSTTDNLQQLSSPCMLRAQQRPPEDHFVAHRSPGHGRTAA